MKYIILFLIISSITVSAFAFVPQPNLTEDKKNYGSSFKVCDISWVYKKFYKLSDLCMFLDTLEVIQSSASKIIPLDGEWLLVYMEYKDCLGIGDFE